MIAPFPLSVGLVLTLVALASLSIGNEHVSTDVYLDLVFYFKYASSAYTLVCPHPNGQVLVKAFKNLLTETQGFIARDDSRKEIVIAFRGSSSVTDILIDAGVYLTPFDSPGVVAPTGTLVHAGFLNAWNAVATIIVHAVGIQLQAHSGYRLVTSGHSLGGAIASIAAMSLKANFPFSNITMYTYGQPRTGNSIYAHWVNTKFGENVFRVVHTYDGVPTVIPTEPTPVFRDQLLAHTIPTANYFYQHHGIEYWQTPDPASQNTTRRCAAHGEDPECSSSILSTGANLAHYAYFGILAIRPFCIEHTELSYPTVIINETAVPEPDDIGERHPDPEA